MLLTVAAIIISLTIVSVIGIISINNLGRKDADQMLHLTAATGSMQLESYFVSVENSVQTVSELVHDSFSGMKYEDLGEQVERSRNLFGRIANNTNGVLTYYFRIDPEVSDTVKGFWYVNLDGKGFREHEVTDITQYDTNDTSSLVWFTVPKATGKSVWLPPYYTDSLDQVLVISYNVPVYWETRFIGVIGIEMDYYTLAREGGKIQIFDSGYAYIMDGDSNIIYHPHLNEMKVELETTDIDSTDQIIGSNHIRYTFDGVEKEAVWVQLSNGMRLYVAAPVSEINSGVKTLLRNILVALLIIVTASALIMMHFSGQITKPLTNLTEAARQVGEGNYDVVLDYQKDDEVGILTRTFKHLVEQTKEHIHNLNMQVYVDALTSVRNKAGYAEYIHKLQDEMDHNRKNMEFAFGVFDCDNLKHINDTFGHDRGDLYLKTASKLICRVFLHSPVFRIGGDEFAVILRNDDFQNREELIARFREMRAEICRTADNEWDQVNVTMGMAVYDAEIDTSVIDVARRADQRMYENKHIRKTGGGNAPCLDRGDA